jgi:radical SAM superfamily enzyme YgiQ (UPF0313 family)
MKILMIAPACPETFWSFKYALQVISKKSLLPPLGLLTVAAMLPPEWEKKLVDMTVEPLCDADIIWADYVFISAMRIHKQSVDEIVTRCRTLGTRVVAGGPLFKAGYERAHDIDHLVLDEAEVTLPVFLKDLDHGRPQYIYVSDQRADLQTTPVPAWDLANLSQYAVMPIQYSRGCPFHCDFCDITMLFGRRMRTKTTAQVLAEMNSLYERGWRGAVFFVDDNFIANQEKLKTEVLPAMIEWMEARDYPFVFNTQASINLSDDEELMRLMVRAGFDTTFVGIETPHDESLAECHKSQNRHRDLVGSVHKIQSFGLQVQGGFILGFDSDTPDTFDQLTRFIQESGIVTAMVGLLNAPPETELYKRLLREKRLLKKIASGNNMDMSMNFVPKMNYEKLIAGYASVLSRIYSHKLYYKRVTTFLRNYRPYRPGKCKQDWYNVGAFLTSVWVLGIRAKGRLYYWKLLLWSLFNRPRLFPLAVTLAVNGFHFRTVFAHYRLSHSQPSWVLADAPPDAQPRKAISASAHHQRLNNEAQPFEHATAGEEIPSVAEKGDDRR